MRSPASRSMRIAKLRAALSAPHREPLHTWTILRRTACLHAIRPHSFAVQCSRALSHPRSVADLYKPSWLRRLLPRRDCRTRSAGPRRVRARQLSVVSRISGKRRCPSAPASRMICPEGPTWIWSSSASSSVRPTHMSASSRSKSSTRANPARASICRSASSSAQENGPGPQFGPASGGVGRQSSGREDLVPTVDELLVFNATRSCHSDLAFQRICRGYAPDNLRSRDTVCSREWLAVGAALPRVRIHTRLRWADAARARRDDKAPA
jgi:hypothetical protein